MFTTTKEEDLFTIFLNKHPNVKPEESLYIDDREYILDKANTYNFHLLLMDRNKKTPISKYEIIHNLQDISVKVK